MVTLTDFVGRDCSLHTVDSPVEVVFFLAAVIALLVALIMKYGDAPKM